MKRAVEFTIGQPVKYNVFVGIPKTMNGIIISTKPGWVRILDDSGVTYNVRPDRIDQS